MTDPTERRLTAPNKSHLAAPPAPHLADPTEPHLAAADGAEPSIGDLTGRLSRDLSQLVRDELALAKAELGDGAKKGGIGAGMLGTAAVALLLAVLVASFGVAELIHGTGLALAWSLLIVGGGWLLLGGTTALAGVSALRRIRPPRRTVTTIRDDVAWARHPTATPGAPRPQ